MFWKSRELTQVPSNRGKYHLDGKTDYFPPKTQAYFLQSQAKNLTNGGLTVLAVPSVPNLLMLDLFEEPRPFGGYKWTKEISSRVSRSMLRSKIFEMAPFYQISGSK